MIIPSQRRALAIGVAVIAACGGAAAAFHYHRLGLTLSHYDARAHLVVARRVFDSITPGWQQVGAVWLPLPHLLNALPVQIDLFYRTGLSAVAISVLAFAVATGAILWIVSSLTDSTWAGAVAAAVFGLNPNVVYLQATPMAEMVLIALTLVAIALLMNWCSTPAERQVRAMSTRVGLVFALACLTRYEAWPVTAAACAIAAWVRWRAGDSPRTALTRVAAIGVYPLGAIVGFSIFSRIIVGSWFADDFYVAENTALGHPYESLAEIVWGIRALSGRGLVIAATLGLLCLLAIGLVRRNRSAALVPLALVATASVPWLAFVDGHPYRIRYMVPLLAAEAVLAGAVAALWTRFRWISIPALALLTVFELHPLDRSAPMVVEAQWDSPNVPARDRVTACLAPNYAGETIMVSLGSLAHYIQDLSRNGFGIHDFLHEGNGDIWLNALHDPQPYVGWMLIEEQAEGGDMLARRARENPAFLAGFSRVCEAAGLVLYRRNPVTAGEDARRR